MKRLAALLVLVAGLVALPLLAFDVPPLKGRVNDYANILSPATVTALEQKLADFESRESTQIAVLTVPDLQGVEIEEFSIKVAEHWKIGQKKIDNGVILLVAKQERRVRIEVGYGLEGRLTDLRSGRIIDGIITPAFKAGNYDKGITDGVDAIIQTVQGEYSAADAGKAEKKGFSSSSVMTPAIFIFFFIGIIGKIKRILGGIAGAVIIPIAGIIIFGFKLFMLLLIPVGFLLGLIIPTLMTLLWLFGGSGGGFGRGSGGGGGFSGGGGGFGGGGASGSW